MRTPLSILDTQSTVICVYFVRAQTLETLLSAIKGCLWSLRWCVEYEALDIYHNIHAAVCVYVSCPLEMSVSWGEALGPLWQRCDVNPSISGGVLIRYWADEDLDVSTPSG